jgi:hypothetical protein
MTKKIEFREADHSYWHEGREFPSVSRILDDIGFKGYYKQTATGAPRGTEIHAAIADYLRGEIVTDWIDIAVKAKEFLDASLIEILAIETPTRKDLPDIAGCVDLVGIIKNEPMYKGVDKRVIVDWKSGKYELRHYYQMQLYCYLYEAKGSVVYYVDSGTYRSYSYDKNIAEMMIAWYYEKITRGTKINE